MKELLQALEAIFLTAITAQTTNLKSVFMGYNGRPEEIPMQQFPFLIIDEQGESVDDKQGGSTSQLRIYQVMFEIGCYRSTLSDAMLFAIELSNEVKTFLEMPANRQKDGHQWGVNITPTAMADDNAGIYRGRRIAVNFFELEDRYQDY